jgi:hypothetical protein
MKSVLYITVSCVAVIIMLKCAPDLVAGGTGEETTNGRVYGIVVDSSADPVKGAVVALVSAQYDPVGDTMSVLTDTTDSAGRYDFIGIDSGVYNVQSSHNGWAQCAILTHVDVYHDTVELPSMKLLPPGAIRIRLGSGSGGYVYIPGTTIFAEVTDQTDWVVLDSVPAGSIPSVAYAEPQNASMAIIRYDIPVDPVQMADVYNPAWLHAGAIRLNTAATGAGVAGTVTNFPVLIRLTSTNFTFGQARASGEDIRFAKADTAFLPYEIERWDPVTGFAEVWVKVDTLHGNDSMQSLTMYWGNADAAPQSNPSAVFDTSEGFVGVWHLGESSGSINDATGDRFNGTRNGNLMRTAGGIGYGQFFADSGDFTDMGDICNPDTSGFTVCAWIKAASVKSNRTIISKSRGGSASSSYGWLMELDNTGGLMVFIATGAGSWGATKTFVLGSSIQIVDSTIWHHVAAVFDRSGNNSCRLYIDGLDVSSFPAGGDIATVGAIVNSAPFRLGADANGGCPWKGSMDECSVSWKIRSPDWIRLCSMNQKQDDKLVTFK